MVIKIRTINGSFFYNVGVVVVVSVVPSINDVDIPTAYYIEADIRGQGKWTVVSLSLACLRLERLPHNMKQELCWGNCGLHFGVFIRRILTFDRVDFTHFNVPLEGSGGGGGVTGGSAAGAALPILSAVFPIDWYKAPGPSKPNHTYLLSWRQMRARSDGSASQNSDVSSPPFITQSDGRTHSWWTGANAIPIPLHLI